jgi:hypothetical protein
VGKTYYVARLVALRNAHPRSWVHRVLLVWLDTPFYWWLLLSFAWEVAGPIANACLTRTRRLLWIRERGMRAFFLSYIFNGFSQGRRDRLGGPAKRLRGRSTIRVIGNGGGGGDMVAAAHKLLYFCCAPHHPLITRPRGGIALLPIANQAFHRPSGPRPAK